MLKWTDKNFNNILIKFSNFLTKNRELRMLRGSFKSSISDSANKPGYLFPLKLTTTESKHCMQSN